jgi:hypothetical protein
MQQRARCSGSAPRLQRLRPRPLPLPAMELFLQELLLQAMELLLQALELLLQATDPPRAMPLRSPTGLHRATLPTLATTPPSTPATGPFR